MKKPIIEKKPIIVEFQGSYQGSTLVSKDMLLLFSARDVKMIDLSDKD